LNILDQFAAVLSAPLPFLLALLAVSIAILGVLRWAFHWRYDGVIEQLNATLRLIAEENRIVKERRADLAATVKELNDKIAGFKDRKDVQPLIQDLSKLTLAADSQLAQLGRANTAVDDALRRGADGYNGKSDVSSGRNATPATRVSQRPPSSSSSRFTAAQAGFFILSQSADRPQR